MARMKKEDRLKLVHQEALAQNDRIQSALRNERLQCLQDRRFATIAGAQWEGPLGEQFENKPRFEANLIQRSVIRITNEYRNNRITVDFVPKDGSENDALADVCDGLYRADEQDSTADEAYDNAFDEGITGGFGAWRLIADEEDDLDEENDRQRIRIEPIFDADSSVFYDIDAKRYDKSDASHCFVIYSMSRDAYKAMWGDDPDNWPKVVHQYEFDWLTPDVVFIAEYYRVEEKRVRVYEFKSLQGEERYLTEEELEEEVEIAEGVEETMRDRLEALGWRETENKLRKSRRVHKYIMSGSKILEDCGYIAGKCIPIVPFYGKRWFIDNVERCSGQTRLGKDLQRLKNMQLSRLGEQAALSSFEKPIFVPEQVAGLQELWANDNIANNPFLLVNPVTDASGNVVPSGPIAYTKPPQIAPAMAALLQLTQQDLDLVLGTPADADKMVSNISGKAVEMIQQRLDMQAFIYMTNMAKSMKRCGEIWLSMAKDVYVEEGRRMKSVGEQGDVSSIEIKRPIVDEKSGEILYENDLSKASLHVAVDVGPSSTTRRDATVRAITGMMQMVSDPQAQQVLLATALMNMDGEGINDVREYFRKQLVSMGVVQPNEQEAAEMEAAQANAQPDPQQQYLMAAAEAERAKGAKLAAEVDETVANTEKLQAETAETLAGIPLREAEAANDMADARAERARSILETGSF